MVALKKCKKGKRCLIVYDREMKQRGKGRRAAVKSECVSTEGDEVDEC
jgi:hypothetical protein